jgi:hypothetical protein
VRRRPQPAPDPAQAAAFLRCVSSNALADVAYGDCHGLRQLLGNGIVQGGLDTIRSMRFTHGSSGFVFLWAKKKMGADAHLFDVKPKTVN